MMNFVSPTDGRYSIVDPPDEYPLTIEDAAMQARVDSEDEDVLAELTRKLAAATAACETHTRRRFMPATVEAKFDGFPCGPIVLEKLPVRSITSVTYIDGSGNAQTLSPSLYQAATGEDDGFITPAYGTDWPTTKAGTFGTVTVTFESGYADQDSVPEDIKEAIRLRLGGFYRNREDVVTGTIATALPAAVESLLAPYVDARC